MSESGPGRPRRPRVSSDVSVPRDAHDVWCRGRRRRGVVRLGVSAGRRHVQIRALLSISQELSVIHRYGINPDFETG